MAQDDVRKAEAQLIEQSARRVRSAVQQIASGQATRVLPIDLDQRRGRHGGLIFTVDQRLSGHLGNIGQEET
jgi:hypothetical protein